MFINPITLKKHKKWSTLHNTIESLMGPPDQWNVCRGFFGEIKWIEGVKKGEIRNTIFGHHLTNLFRPILDSEYLTGNRKQWESLNHDIYAYDPSQGVAVIQARQCLGNKYGKQVRKTYFLVGQNEITKDFFRHPVGSHAVQAAVKKDPCPVACIQAIQRWMWQVTEKQLEKSVRQGDILLVPERGEPKGENKGQVIRVGVNHVIVATDIRVNGKTFALNPSAIHARGQHATVTAQGWHSVRVGREAKAWDFASRIGD